MHFEFTQATHDHITELVELINSAYRGDSSRQGWTTEADILDGQRTDPFTLKSQMDEEGSAILIAQDEDDEEKICGCVNLKKQGDKCYLGMLTVAPNLQNKGLGKLFLEEAEAFAQYWDCTSIYMTVISVRSELIAWYERHGFRKTGETSPFPYGDERFGIPRMQGLEFIILKKNI